MRDRIGDMTHGRFLVPTAPGLKVQAAGEADAPAAPGCDGVVSPTYDQVLEDVNRLSHLLGRFLQSGDGLVGPNAVAGGPGKFSVRDASPQRRDSGARIGAQQSRKLAAERPAPELVSEGLAEHEWTLAAAGGDLGRMAALLDSEPGLLNRKDPVSGLTAAHWFAKQGHDTALMQLGRLARGRGLQLELNCRASGGGYTPLHLAAMQGHQMVIKLLVGAYNADVDARDYSGRKAWQYLGSAMPGKLRQLLGAEEELPAVPPVSRDAGGQGDGPPKKSIFPRISSIPRFLQPALGRWKKTRLNIDGERMELP
ncbi:ankyrin repeat domain-containing protein SOWAHC [Narcine bancroftii]|uniref:ankyrin repeat domain-containing protein SOWAHC n=1 Tax=Narcine bancroftii TaxID=1343680 RepID=UPI003831EFF3